LIFIAVPSSTGVVVLERRNNSAASAEGEVQSSGPGWERLGVDDQGPLVELVLFEGRGVEDLVVEEIGVEVDQAGVRHQTSHWRETRLS
jgi:hypothetical protein